MKFLKISVFFTLLTVTPQFIYAQEETAEELFKTKKFEKLATFENRVDELTAVEAYYVGYAFYRLKDDKKAIAMYDKAIEKGLDDWNIYFFKGLSLLYDSQFDKAIETFHIAVDRNPTSQKVYTELANSYYYSNRLDSALKYFYKARGQAFQVGDPYQKLPFIYHIREEFEKALEEYKISASLIDKEDPVYLELLAEIGLLEYSITKNYPASIEAYRELIILNPENYDLYPKLIKSYYADKNYAAGDSLFYDMRDAFNLGVLSERYMKTKDAPIAEFEWNGQRVLVVRNFNEPKEVLDVKYKVFLISKDSHELERWLRTEQTVQLEEGGPKHLLAEWDVEGGAHSTYPFGWPNDDIDYESLKRAIIQVLDGEIVPAASSKPGNQKK